MDSPEISRTIRTKTDEREEAHIRSFTKWINSKLFKAQPKKIEISDLFEDLRTGHVLLSLLEILRQEKLPREKGKLRVHHVSNIDIVLKTLAKDNIKLYGISGQAIADGVHKSTLGLVWSIILHYQVHGAMQEEEEEDPPQGTATTASATPTRKKSLKVQSEAAVEDRLLRWVQSATEGYDDIVQVKDLTKSWRDGRAFNLLIHVHRNDLINLDEVERMTNEGRLENAFTVAEKQLHVQKLLEPSDVDQEKPDKKLVMMYVSSLYESLREYEPVKAAKRRKVVKEEMVVSVSTNVESSVPSEQFLGFKDDLSQASNQVQRIENSLSKIEETFQNRIVVKSWEEYESEFVAAESALDKLSESGIKATNDPGVQPFEVEEIRSDLNAIEVRWSSLRSRTEEQRKSVIHFRAKEGKELNEWNKQAGTFLDWMDNMDERLDAIEEMKSEDDINVLSNQSQALQDMLHVMSTDPVTKQTFEFGRSLVTGNVLSAETEVKMKEQLIEMEKELETLKARASQDVERFNGYIDILKRTQSGHMGKWRKEAEAMCDWLDTMEDQLESLDSHGGNMNIKDVYRHLEECEKLHETIKNDSRPHSVVEYGEILMAEKTLSKEQKLKIEKQLTEMKNEWKSLIAKSAEIKTRLTTIRDESELEEKHKAEEWITRFELLLKQMSKVKGTIGKLASLPIISERSRAFQECIKVVESIKPEYQNAVECAEEVITHEACPDWEKSQVKDDVDLLKTTWASVLDVMDKEDASIEAIMSKASDEQLEKVNEWREKYKEVDIWYSTISPKVEGNFNMGKTLPHVRKQITEQEEISNEMVETHESVEYLLANGQSLLQNVNTPEAEKNKLRKDIANLVERWENLSNTVNNRMLRLAEMEKHLQENLAGKLDEFSNQASSFDGWLTREEKKFQSMGGIAPNLEAAMKQKPRVEALEREMKQEEKKLTALVSLGEDILVDSSLSEEDSNKLQQDLNTFKNRWTALDEKINWRIQRLNETISRLGSQQQDKLKKWRENAVQISDWLDKAQLRLAERGAIGSDLKSVSAQKEDFQVFLDESLGFQRHIYGFTEFGENLRTDPCINEEERSKVQQKTKSLNDRWDVIVQQINNHHNALEEQLEQLEDRHKAELLGRWQVKYEPFSKWIINMESTIKSLKDIGDNALVVQGQQDETKVLMSQVSNKEPEFNDVIFISQTVNDDPLIDDNEAKTVQEQASSLSSKWVVVNETLNGRSESLRIRGAFLGEQEQHLLHEWRRNIEPFNNWLSKVEDDGAHELNANVGVNTIKDYSVRCKTLEREVDGRKPVLEEIIKLGEKLLSDTAVRDEEKIHIQEEMEIFQDRWKKLHVKIHDNNKWADIKLIELAKKEQETLDVWRKNVEPFSTWLEETNGKLDGIQNDSGDTENLEQRHLALQRIKEDVMRHEEALTRIVTIVGKLADDENVSETEKNNIKAEMNRLQEKWNTTQNNVNLNYLSITEALMELAQKEKATLEKWKKQTDPFKEWIVEAKGRFDNLQHGAGYDVVQEQHEKLETLSRELVDHEPDYENVSQLKNTILEDGQLSTAFKDSIRDEGDALDKKWRELNDNIMSQSNRVQKQMVTLDNSQRDQLDRWQEGFKTVNNNQMKTENDLKLFDSLALDVDGARKQYTDLKEVEQEIQANRSQVEELLSFCAEISSGSNIANKEKTRMKKEADLMKERQNKQEKLFVDYQRRLEGKIRELEDRQSSKLEKWKTSSQPLHEWLDGIDDDAKEFDVIGGNVVEVHGQFDELQSISKEFKETEQDLFNVLKLGEELSADAQVSAEVRESVSQDVVLLRENHSTVAELLKSQREKMKSQLLKLQQHQEKCLIDWNQRKTSVDVRVKTMEKRTGHWPLIGDTMEDVQSQKDVLKNVEKDVESIEWELAAILEYGEALCKDKSIFDKEKERIREEMNDMETAFRNSQKNVEDRKLSLNEKLDGLRKARANEFLTKWEKSWSKTVKWMETCEEAIQFDTEDQQSLADVRERLVDVDDISERCRKYQPEWNFTIKCGEDVIKEPSVESAAKEKVEDEVSSLKERWHRINSNLDSLLSRLEDQEMNLAKQHDELSEKWLQDVQETREWVVNAQEKLQSVGKGGNIFDYDKLAEHKQELQIMIEMLPKYEVKVNELATTSRGLAQNSKTKTESEKFINETQTLQNDFEVLRLSVETAKSNYDSMAANLESVHGQKLTDWDKKSERIEQQLCNIETKWQQINFLENSNEDEIKSHRKELESVVFDLNNLQPDYDRHCSVGRQLSNNPALNSETRNVVDQKVTSYQLRWNALQISRKLLNQLPRVAVEETVIKLEERQVESANMDDFNDIFGIDSTDGNNCQELVDWYVEYDSSLKWCEDATDKVAKRSQPEEYMVLVEKQHGEIGELIQLLATYEATVSKVLDKGRHLFDESESLRLSRNERSQLDDDLRALKTKWDDLQENAFDAERSLNEHLNKLREYHDWEEKAGALCQWLEMTDRKLDCCSEVSEDLDERDKQEMFLQKFVTEKKQNEESISDVFSLGKYIVSNHLVLKEKYDEVDKDIDKFKNMWNSMLSKADEFCKLFGIPFSHIDMSSADPLLQWKQKVEEVEKWISDAREKLNLKNNLKNYAVLKALPETANDISKGIDNYCVPQLNEITSRAQDMLDEDKNSNTFPNAEITDTIAKLSDKIKDLRLYTASQKVHVRNATLAFFTEKLSSSEEMVDRVLDDLKKLNSVGSESTVVRDQVDLIKNSEDYLQTHLAEFQESKRQIIEMEDKGYLSTDGFEGTLKIKTDELEPRMVAVEKQFNDTKNRLAKGVISFHGQHKDDVKKWLKYCERKLNEIDSDADNLDSVYEEYSKLQELRREMIKGEKSFLNTLELNERLIAEAMLNEQQANEYQGEMQAIAKTRNKLQRRMQEKNTRLYATLIEGLNGMLSTSIHAFEEADAALHKTKLSADFDTATEQMDGSKRIADNVDKLAEQAQGTVELAQKITTCGILILNEEDKSSVDGEIKKLKEYASTMTAKSHLEFNRLLDEYLVMFRKEIEDRKTWIAVSENRMSSSYLEIEDLPGFQKELIKHKEFEQELNNRNMEKMADAAERVTELENTYKLYVKNLEKRWRVLKQWSDEYSLDLQRTVKEWKAIKQEEDLLVEWLDPHEEQLSKITEKINWVNEGGIKQQIDDLKAIQIELEDKGVVLSNLHVKGMALMKFLTDGAAASRTVDRDLAQLDRRWNAMAKDIIARIELLRNIQYKQSDINIKKTQVNKYIDETNAELDEHETKTQRLLGNVSPDVEDGETAKEKKVRMKKEKETLQQDVERLIKSLEERIADFPKHQALVDRINALYKNMEDVADEDSKVTLHDELVNFNARWQVIVTRLEDYSDNELPDQSHFGCMGFVKRRLSGSTF